MTTLPLPFVAPVRGISNYRRSAATVTDGEPVRCVHEPDNAHDPNAFRIARHDDATVGYLPRNLASRVAAAGHTRLEGTVIEVLGDPGDQGGLRVEWTHPHTDRGDGGRTAAEETVVRTSTGAALGTLLEATDRLVRVRRPDGTTVTYPRRVLDQHTVTTPAGRPEQGCVPQQRR